MEEYDFTEGWHLHRPLQRYHKDDAAYKAAIEAYEARHGEFSLVRFLRENEQREGA